LDNGFIASDEGVDGQGLAAARPASFSLTGDAATHSLGHTRKQVRATMTSALPRWLSVNVRCGMGSLTLREAMDSDVVARWKRSIRHAR